MAVAPDAEIASEGNEMVFETPRGSRATILLLAILATGFCLVFSLAVGGGAFAAARAWDAHWLVAGAGGLLASAILVYFAWKTIVASLRFRVTLGRDAVELGRGRLRRRFAYCDVEMIMLPHGKEENGVRLNSRGQSAFVCLSPSDEATCAIALRQRCANAIFVDHSAREYLPQASSDQPLVALRALYRRYRTLARLSLFCSLTLTVVGFEMGMELCGGIGGARPNGHADDWRFFALCVVCVPLLCRFGLVKWQQARAIKVRLPDFRF